MGGALTAPIGQGGTAQTVRIARDGIGPAALDRGQKQTGHHRRRCPVCALRHRLRSRLQVPHHVHLAIFLIGCNSAKSGATKPMRRRSVRSAAVKSGVRSETVARIECDGLLWLAVGRHC